MGDLKGIFALLISCLSLCIVLNFLLFYKERKVVADGLILGALLFANQMLEFITSFWLIDNKILTFAYIMTFNFTISFASYFVLKQIQPDSKNNWKAFMFTIMLLPAGFVYISSFKFLAAGFFFSEYRYFASPFAGFVVGVFQAFWGVYFLVRHFYSAGELKKQLHYKLLVWCYAIPLVVIMVIIMLSMNNALYFESIYSKLLFLNLGSYFYFVVKQRAYVRDNS